MDYVLKPVSAARIERTLDRVREECKARKSAERYTRSIRKASGILNSAMDRVIAWKNDRIFLLDPDEVLYFTVTNGEITVVTESDTYIAKGTLNSWEENLSESGFLRCHKSHIINLHKILFISPMFNNTFMIKLRNCAAEIPVSRRYAPDLRRALNI